MKLTEKQKEISAKLEGVLTGERLPLDLKGVEGEEGEINIKAGKKVAQKAVRQLVAAIFPDQQEEESDKKPGE
jgi:hypothetical protein